MGLKEKKRTRITGFFVWLIALGIILLSPATGVETLTEEQKELAITAIKGYAGVQDAAIGQKGNDLSLAIIAGYATNEEYAKELGDSFVRLVKTFGPEDPPGKEIGPGIYDYLIGVYRPNGENIVLGAKVSGARKITW